MGIGQAGPAVSIDWSHIRDAVDYSDSGLKTIVEKITGNSCNSCRTHAFQQHGPRSRKIWAQASKDLRRRVHIGSTCETLYRARLFIVTATSRLWGWVRADAPIDTVTFVILRRCLFRDATGS